MIERCVIQQFFDRCGSDHQMFVYTIFTRIGIDSCENRTRENFIRVNDSFELLQLIKYIVLDKIF